MRAARYVFGESGGDTNLKRVRANVLDRVLEEREARRDLDLCISYVR